MDDHAPLDRLAELLPPPTHPAPFDREAVEATLGVALPPDYSAFCERWGPAGDIETSGPVSVYRLPEESAPSQAILAEEVEDELVPPLPLFPEPGGMLLWGETETEARLLWRTAPRPERWEVVVLALDEPIATGLPFAAWLVAALERRLPEEQLPGELRPEALDEAPPQWFPRSGRPARDDEPLPEDVLAGFGSEELDGRLAHVAELDFSMLRAPRREALDAFVGQLDPALATQILDATVDRDGERVFVGDRAALRPVMLAAVEFAATRLGVRADLDPRDERLPPG